MRPIQHWLASRWDHSLPSIDLPLRITPDMLEVIGVWSDAGWTLQGVPLLSPQPALHLFTDSSMEGWGASLSEKDDKDVWRGSQRPLHINHLEMLAVKLVLQHYKSELQSCTVLLLCDNATVASYLRKKGGTPSRDLCLLSREILQICRAWQTYLLVRHILSHQNVIADSLSCSKPLSTEWHIDTRLFKQILDLLPTLSIDQFFDLSQCATPGLSISLRRHEREWDRCAIPHVGFSGGTVLYAYPPTLLLTAVLGRIRATTCSVLLLAPCVAQASMVQLPCGVVSGARCTSPARSILPSAGEFHSPVVQNV